MHGTFSERACAVMAMQAFAIVIGVIELDGFRNSPEILDVHVTEAAKLRENRPIHDIVGMARVASFVAGGAGVLEMRGWDVHRIVDIKAPAVWVHNMARETEPCLFGALHVFRRAHGCHDYRKQKVNNKPQLLASTLARCKKAACGERGVCDFDRQAGFRN